MDASRIAFYETAAQIIVVLFIVVTIELRFIDQVMAEPEEDKFPLGDILGVVGTYAMMTLGVIASLSALVNDESTRFFLLWTKAALFIGGMTATALALLGLATRYEKEHRARRFIRTLWVAGWILILIIVFAPAVVEAA